MDINKYERMQEEARAYSRSSRAEAMEQLEKIKIDNLINQYQSSSSVETRQQVTAVVNNRNTQWKVVLNTMQEFDELKATIEAEGDGKVEIVSEAAEDQDKYAGKDFGDGYGGIDDAEENGSSEHDDEIAKLEEKIEKMEDLKDVLMAGEGALSGTKSSKMNESMGLNILMREKVEYEKAQDKLDYKMAEYTIRKNILAARREVIILKLGRAKDEDTIDSLMKEYEKIDIDITQLDIDSKNDYDKLVKVVDVAKSSLNSAEKTVSDSVRAGIDGYTHSFKYSEDGILQGEATKIQRAHKETFTYITEFGSDIVSNGKESSIKNERIQIGNETVHITTQETSKGVNKSISSDGVEQMSTGLGHGNYYVKKDKNGSLVADNPEAADLLNAIGVQNTESIAKIRDEIKDEKATRDARDKEERNNEGEIPLDNPNNN